MKNSSIAAHLYTTASLVIPISETIQIWTVSLVIQISETIQIWIVSLVIQISDTIQVWIIYLVIQIYGTNQIMDSEVGLQKSFMQITPEVH